MYRPCVCYGRGSDVGWRYCLDRRALTLRAVAITALIGMRPEALFGLDFKYRRLRPTASRGVWCDAPNGLAIPRSCNPSAR
jgi:hypothetical protein